MGNRYLRTNQYHVADVDAGVDLAGVYTADQAFTCTGAGTFKIRVAGGCTGTVSGTNVASSPVTLAEGENTITTTGAVADGSIDITIGASTTVVWSNINIWADSDTGYVGYAVPSSSDSVLPNAGAFPAASTAVTVDATAYCLSMDWTGATNTPTLNRGGNTLGIYGNLTFITDMTLSSFGITAFYETSNIITAGKVFTGSVQFNGTSYSLQDNFDGSPGEVTLAKGTLTTNNYSISAATFSIPTAAAKVFTLGSSAINCTAWNYSGSNLTLTANTATINVSGTGAFAGGSADWNGATFNLVGSAHTVSGNFTCKEINYHPASHTTANVLTLTSGNTITCTDSTVDGGTRATQVLIQSSTLGTAATITSTNKPTLTCVDLMDVTFTNAADYSAQDDIGDCQGNNGITFPAAVAQTSADTQSWGTAAGWTSGIVPRAQDDVTCSHSKTIDIPRIGKSITFTGTPTVTQSVNIYIYGSLTIPSGATWNANSKDLIFSGRGDYVLTTNGVTLYQITLNNPTGKITLGSDLTLNRTGSNGVLFFLSGSLGCTFDTAGYDITMGGRFSDYVGNVYNTIYLRDSVITLNDTGNIVKFSLSATETLYAGTSTIILTNSGTNAQTFAGGGLTYNNVQVAGAGAYALTVTGNNVFNTFTVDRSEESKEIILTGTNQTVTNFLCPVSTTNTLTITGGTITKSGGGQIALDYLALNTSAVTPAATWYAGEHSYISGGTVIGWIFGDPSGGGTRSLMPAIII